MQQDYVTTKLPTAATQFPSRNGAAWTSPNNILTDNGVFSTLAYSLGGDSGALLQASGFGYALPPDAVIDGIAVLVDGSQFSMFGSVSIGIPGTTTKDIGSLATTYGGATDKWGASVITPASLATITVGIDTGDISGGDGSGQVDYLQVSVYWHIEFVTAPADVPTRVSYKAYSREGRFLGELPNVSTAFGFAQDMNSAGSTIQVTCARTIQSGVITEPLLTELGEPLLTEDNQEILATIATNVIARGDSTDEVIFKNSNRIKIWIYNYWYPNGKLMFSGQVNRVGVQYGGGKTAVELTVISDGLDMTNFIARGFPFTYTNDVVQTAQDGFVTVSEGVGWVRYGQTFTTGVAVNNVGAIELLLHGTAQVTVSLYDSPTGNFLGSITKGVALGSPAIEQFNFPQLLDVPASTSRFFNIRVAPGQSINVYRNSVSTTYASGSLHESLYTGGSGGGAYSPIAGDLYFITKHGSPTTAITFNSKDPVTNMASDVLADYNTRGGYIKKRNFRATGLSLTYPFNMATVFDVLKKVIELSPTGYYFYVDLGLAKIDILQQSVTADFTIVRGRDINKLNLSLSIEQVKNYLLLTGGEVAGTNLFREYPDPQSAAFYGPRYTPKTDNRVVLAATADAIGQTFIAENSDETQETSVTVLNTAMDTTLLTPGKTIGFKNFDNFIDGMVLPIVRREFNLRSTTLTLGRLPVRMNDELQRINRDLQNEQTAKNPSIPT